MRTNSPGRRFLAAGFSVFLFSLPSFAEEAAEAVREPAAYEVVPDTFILCKHGKEVRSLRTRSNKEKGKCETYYTKYGKDQMVGGGHNNDTCAEISARIRNTLEAADWKCREVKESTVSEIPDEVL